MPNIFEAFFGSVAIIAISFEDTLNILAWLPFSGVTLIVEFTKSMSVHLRFQAHQLPALVVYPKFWCLPQER